MVLLQAILESFTLVQEAEKVLKGKKDFSLSLTLINPIGDGKSLEVIIPIKGLEPGKKVDFSYLDGAEKEVFRAKMLPNTTMKVEFLAIEKGASFFRELKKYIASGIIAGAGLVTGNASTLITIALVKTFVESASKKAAGKEDKPIVLGEAIFTYDMMKSTPNGKVSIIAPEKILLESYEEHDADTGEVRFIRRYLPGKFGIAEAVMHFSIHDSDIVA